MSCRGNAFVPPRRAPPPAPPPPPPPLALAPRRHLFLPSLLSLFSILALAFGASRLRFASLASAAAAPRAAASPASASARPRTTAANPVVSSRRAAPVALSARITSSLCADAAARNKRFPVKPTRAPDGPSPGVVVVPAAAAAARR